MTDVFAKCRLPECQPVKDLGVYPYYHPVEERPGDGEVVVGGRVLVQAGSNDHLGLSGDPRVKEAAVAAIRRLGTGSGGSRLALGALLGPGDVVIGDRLVHACLIDAVRLGGARLRRYRHNDMDHLERLLGGCPRFRASRSGFRGGPALESGDSRLGLGVVVRTTRGCSWGGVDVGDRGPPRRRGAGYGRGMRLIKSRFVPLALFAVCVLAAGCGEVNDTIDKAQACLEAPKIVTDLAVKVKDLTDDPKAMEKALDDAAGKLNDVADKAANTTLKQASEDLAKTLGGIDVNNVNDAVDAAQKVAGEAVDYAQQVAKACS
ncbi:aminotransferase class I/II-fold pyridoxal phosphate-dependent enzyme [Nonomuraea sp. NPDC052265]|uniref:aminotransferase class I/II-fold pyridoxal phosphate-dependent enzyme n=1 Tax=Nonomuraea sp. NPDC052265 TaxID=3364374 RepID=UPI0037C8D7A3